MADTVFSYSILTRWMPRKWRSHVANVQPATHPIARPAGLAPFVVQRRPCQQPERSLCWRRIDNKLGVIGVAPLILN